jgi:hypothetical protein
MQASPQPLPSVSQIVVYCDESCHDLNRHHAWMTIGGLRLPRERKRELTRELRARCREHGLRGEVKWTKVSAQRLDDYKAVVDFFFDKPELRFRTIVVEQAKVRMDEFHGKDRELAFYKFYYEMLEKWLEEPGNYVVLLDYKQNRGADRYTTLRRYLEAHLRGTAWIADLTVIDSRESPLAQLCDLLTGAVAAAYNGTRLGGPKEALAAHIASRAKFPTLRWNTGLAEGKFNIFKIDLG